MMAPTAVRATPKSMTASLAQWKPSFHMEKKLEAARITPPMIDPIPAMVCPTVLRMEAKLEDISASAIFWMTSETSFFASGTMVLEMSPLTT